MKSKLMLNRKNFNTAIPLLEREYEKIERQLEDSRPPEYCHIINYTVSNDLNGDAWAEYDEENPPPQFLYNNKTGEWFALTDEKCKEDPVFEYEDYTGDLYGEVEDG